MKFIEKFQKIFALCGMIGPFFYALIWILHGILVALLAFFAMFGILAMWRRLKKVDEWKGYDTYSLITFIFTLIFGLVAAIPIGSEIMGLTEGSSYLHGTILLCNWVKGLSYKWMNCWLVGLNFNPKF